MNNDLISQNGKAEYIEVIPRFEEFEERNDDCDECPFYCSECSGDGNKRCFSADILELLKRGRDLEMVADPVRHGRWAHLGGDEWCCTFCGEVIHTEGSWEKPTRKYCHECGARMDGDVNG